MIKIQLIALLFCIAVSQAGAEVLPPRDQGHVNQVNLNDRTIVIDDRLFKLAPGTSVTGPNGPISPQVLQSGMKVRWRMIDSDGQKMISHLWLLPR